MRRPAAALGTAAFFAAAPGVVAGVVPWLLTGWRAGGSVWAPLRWLGVALVGAGAAILVASFGRFVIEGAGTPAPVAPTEELVVRGWYRHVRNPMYLAVVAVIVGQALLLGRPVLCAYAGAVWVVGPRSSAGTRSRPWRASSAPVTTSTAGRSRPGSPAASLARVP